MGIAANSSPGRLLPARSPLVSADVWEQASRTRSWGQRGLTAFPFGVEWEFLQCPARGLLVAAFSCGGRSWVGRPKFDFENTNLRYTSLLESGALRRAAGPPL